MELADTTAWVWSRRADAGAIRIDFDNSLIEGQIATCDMVRLELLYSARNGRDFITLREELDGLPNCPIGADEWARALDVYEQLAQLGGTHHRSVKHADLLIAAAAESVGMTVLHYDEDFDRIAAITGQPVRWIAPRSTL